MTHSPLTIRAALVALAVLLAGCQSAKPTDRTALAIDETRTHIGGAHEDVKSALDLNLKIQDGLDRLGKGGAK